MRAPESMKDCGMMKLFVCGVMQIERERKDIEQMLCLRVEMETQRASRRGAERDKCRLIETENIETGEIAWR